MKLKDEIGEWIDVYCPDLTFNNREDLIHHIMDVFGVRLASLMHDE